MNALKKKEGEGVANLKEGFTLTFGFAESGKAIITIATLAGETLLWPVEGERFVAFFVGPREEHARRFAELVAAITGMKTERDQRSTTNEAIFTFT